MRADLMSAGVDLVKKILLLLLICISCLLAACSIVAQPEKSGAKLRVAASFYPMAEFTRAVGGDRVEIFCLVPDGVEPHDWEPSPRDLTRLGRAKLFVYNGIVESWAPQALQALDERPLKAVQAGSGLYQRPGAQQDPHVWISPAKAVVEVARIAEALAAVDPQNAAYYQERREAYSKELQLLDKQLRELSAKSSHKSFVTTHAAFGHLAADYGLEQLAVSGLSPEAEPTSKDLQKLIKLVQAKNMHYVFFETLASPKIAQLLAEEAKAEAMVLDPLEGLDEEGRRRGLTYCQIMQNNIDNLRKALNVEEKSKD